MSKRFREIVSIETIVDDVTGKRYVGIVDSAFIDLVNELHEENYKIKSILLKRVEELNDAYNKSAKAGMPTGGIIGELDSFEEICRIMEWIE